MQAKSRVNPTTPAQPATRGRPGRRARREFEYRRHDTAVLYAGLNVHDGQVTAWVTDSTRASNFIAFLTDLVAATPAGLELHCIVDNLSAHGTEKVTEFLDQPAHHHVFLHRTPTHASWFEGPGIFRTGNPLRFLSRKRGCPCLTSAGRSLRNTRTRSLGWWSRNPRRFRRPPGKSG